MFRAEIRCRFLRKFGAHQQEDYITENNSRHFIDLFRLRLFVSSAALNVLLFADVNHCSVDETIVLIGYCKQPVCGGSSYILILEWSQKETGIKSKEMLEVNDA